MQPKKEGFSSKAHLESGLDASIGSWLAGSVGSFHAADRTHAASWRQ
jgi:hypothetical protein